MSRNVLDEAHIHPAVRQRVQDKHSGIVDEVRAAITEHDVVVVGMRQNPWPRKARQALDAAAISYKYLEYGSYFSEWRRRLALKMWTGWPTFPMVFVGGVLVGGAEDLKRLIENGELRQILSGKLPRSP